MNPNDYVRIKPTENGWKAIKSDVDQFNAVYGHFVKRLYPEPDEHGYIKEQFHELMRLFDWNRCLVNGLPFTDMQIVGPG